MISVIDDDEVSEIQFTDIFYPLINMACAGQPVLRLDPQLVKATAVKQMSRTASKYFFISLLFFKVIQS